MSALLPGSAMARRRGAAVQPAGLDRGPAPAPGGPCPGGPGHDSVIEPNATERAV